MKRNITTLLVLLACTVSTGRLAAQQFFSSLPSKPRPDVLSPDPSLWWLGINAGLNLNTHSGDIITDYCQCRFVDPTGRGALFGVELSHQFNPDIGFVIKLLFDDKSAKTSSDTVKDAVVMNDVDGSQSTQRLSYTRNFNSKLQYLTVFPAIQVFPLWNFYLFAGPALSFPIAPKYTVDEKMNDPGFVYLENRKTEITLQNEGIPSIESPRLDIRGGIGLNLKLSRDVMFAPEVSFGYPLNKVNNDDNWLASTLHLVGVLKFRL